MVVSIGLRTAAVLFTDVVSSTVLRSRIGEERAERLRVVLDGVVRRAIEGSGGTVVKSMGDGHMATFSSAADAVAAAVAVQQGIDRHNRRVGAEPLAVRVGVSAGDVAFDGLDCHGLPVIEAQRLEAAGRPGQILCAEVVVQMARGRGDHRFEPVGALDLKGLSTPVEAREVVWAPSASPTEEALPPALRQAPSLPFAGREAEHQVLAEAWERCRAGGFAMVLVAGESGIGKTRLISEVAADASVDGAMVLAGRCDEDIRVPFGPFVEALRWMLQHVPEPELRERLGKHPGELVTLVPEIAELLPGVAPSASADAETERFQLFSAVCSWLGAGGTHAPTVLALDDLHWADKGTVQLLRHLASTTPGGLLVLGTYRHTDISRGDPLGAALADLRRAAAVTRLVLGGLSEAGVRELVEAAGGRPLESPGVAFAQLVRAETAGNPLFVSEVLLHLAERRDLVLRDGWWTSQRNLAAIGIPEGITDVIGRRLARLAPETEAVLRTAAIIGLEFEVGVLAAVLDLSEGDVLGLLEQALTAALVTEVGIDRFRFAHALVRDTLHDELTVSRRTREHRRVAQAIELRHADDLDRVSAELARHWGEACAGGDTTPAVEWARRAGEHDLGRRAPDEAARWFARALELLADAPADERRRHLMLRRAYAQMRADDPDAALTAHAAAKLAIEARDVDAAAAALCLSARTGYDGVQPADEEKIGLLDQVLDLVERDRPELRGRLLAQLSGELLLAGGTERRDSILAELRQLMDTGARRVARHEDLPPQATSAGRARRVVAEVLEEAGLEELADVAVLLVSELVTNAVLHAGSEVGLTVAADDGSLRVEVRDGSSISPGIRHYEDEATTGRGVGLVELLAADWGVQAEPGGKTVWFTLGAAGTPPSPAPAADDLTQAAGASPGLTVRFRRLPVHLMKATLQHGDAVLLELALAVLSGQVLDGLETWEGVSLDLSPVLDPVEAALAEGRDLIDVDVELPPGSDVGAARRRDLVLQAEEVAEAGGFLASQPLPEVEHTRRWLFTEIIGQAGGAAPTPWVAGEELGPTDRWVRLSDRERAELQGLEGPVVVADESNHIVHVDEAAATLLGWEVDDLVGRRLTTIVPPALRGAHIAGYTRYQLTRTPVIIGSAVQVPALRRDGSTVEVSLLIQPYTSADGRSGYQARIEALSGRRPRSAHPVARDEIDEVHSSAGPAFVTARSQRPHPGGPHPGCGRRR